MPINNKAKAGEALGLASENSKLAKLALLPKKKGAQVRFRLKINAKFDRGHPESMQSFLRDSNTPFCACVAAMPECMQRFCVYDM